MSLMGEIISDFLAEAGKEMIAMNRAKSAKALAEETAKSIVAQGYHNCTVTIEGETYRADLVLNTPAPVRKVDTGSGDYTFLHLYRYLYTLAYRTIEDKVGDHWKFVASKFDCTLTLYCDRTPIVGIQFLDAFNRVIFMSSRNDQYGSVEKVKVYRVDSMGRACTPVLGLSAGSTLDAVDWRALGGAHGSEAVTVMRNMMNHVYNRSE